MAWQWAIEKGDYDMKISSGLQSLQFRFCTTWILLDPSDLNFIANSAHIV